MKIQQLPHYSETVKGLSLPNENYPITINYLKKIFYGEDKLTTIIILDNVYKIKQKELDFLQEHVGKDFSKIIRIIYTCGLVHPYSVNNIERDPQDGYSIECYYIQE